MAVFAAQGPHGVQAFAHQECRLGGSRAAQALRQLQGGGQRARIARAHPRAAGLVGIAQQRLGFGAAALPLIYALWIPGGYLLGLAISRRRVDRE